MKRKWIFALVVLALVTAIAFTGCTGQDGKVYLSVSAPSSYGAWCGMASGLGLPSSWSFDTDYQVNPGTWTGYYNLAYYSGAYDATYYYFTVNSDVNAIGLSKTYYDQDDAAYAAYYAYTNDSSYESFSISLQKEKGSFLKDGDDRHYQLYLSWDLSGTTISYNGAPMASRVLSDTAAATVKEFSNEYDTITLTLNKVQAPQVPLKSLSASHLVLRAASANAVTASKK